MNAIAEAIADDLASEFGGKVIDFTKPSPEAEVERLADAHRRMVAKSSQRIAETRKSLKTRLASLEGDKRSLRAAFDRDTAFICELIAEAKDKAERDTAADRKLVAASRAALDALAE